MKNELLAITSGIDDGGELKFSTHKEYCNADRTT